MITDGALATELERLGCNLNDPLWSASISINHPELIKQVHYSYFEAGADCAITATYQATIDGFMDRGFSKNEAKRLIKNIVTIALEARDQFWQINNNEKRPKPLVAGSVGPYGAYLADGSEYHGNYEIKETELYQFHKERIELLVEAGVDVLACETIPSMTEAKILTQVLHDFPEITTWITFSTKDFWYINDGNKIADCAALLDGEDQVEAIGINCTSPNYVKNLIGEIKKSSSKPIIVYPNSGETYHPDSKTWGETSVMEQFNEFTKEWFQQGATIIGGCCRTIPEDISNLAHWAR